MKEIYILFECDSWHSANSMEVVFVGSYIEVCCRAAHCKGATDEQVKQLRDIRQSQGTCNRDYEFQIERWDVGKI